LFSQTFAFAAPQKKKSGGVRSGDLGGQIPLEITLSPKTSSSSFAFLLKVGVVFLILVKMRNEGKQHF
jgi:hypothetical protein